MPYLQARAAEKSGVPLLQDLPSKVDTFTAALEANLPKARQVKQGMMQELLTGRIRLT